MHTAIRSCLKKLLKFAAPALLAAAREDRLTEGLIKAVDRFDHRKGFRFSTYGSWWIRHAISRSIALQAIPGVPSGP